VIGQAPVRVAVEAAVRMGWERFIGEDGKFVGMTGFGASAPYERLYKEFGITAEAGRLDLEDLRGRLAEQNVGQGRAGRGDDDVGVAEQGDLLRHRQGLWTHYLEAPLFQRRFELGLVDHQPLGIAATADVEARDGGGGRVNAGQHLLAHPVQGLVGRVQEVIHRRGEGDVADADQRGGHLDQARRAFGPEQQFDALALPGRQRRGHRRHFVQKAGQLQDSQAGQAVEQEMSVVEAAAPGHEHAARLQSRRVVGRGQDGDLVDQRHVRQGRQAGRDEQRLADRRFHHLTALVDHGAEVGGVEGLADTADQNAVDQRAARAVMPGRAVLAGRAPRHPGLHLGFGKIAAEGEAGYGALDVGVGEAVDDALDVGQARQLGLDFQPQARARLDLARRLAAQATHGAAQAVGQTAYRRHRSH
jgi:hypothetical protein